MEYTQPDNIVCPRCHEPMITHVIGDRGREIYDECPNKCGVSP